MGCCYSSENEASDQGEESKPLLPPASSPPNKSMNGMESCCTLPSARTDEQALLSSILAKTAILGTLGPPQVAVTQPRALALLLALGGGWAEASPAPPPPHLSPVPPFSRQVSRIAAYAYSALSQIRVDAKEDLVVQFGIP
ncbi:ragulator complex protein LAMTOR1 [Notechis scutatus]|uniref:Ragulator complex protein LAMTOR1 n=1 Tax=Notechis scutatus TaxID=8663 RepID=A0A6J1VW45_9SAUR|nr:ragulator complex protein LAMTOR1 [Notechis scutatus]